MSRSDGGGQRPTKQSHALLVEQGVATPCSVEIATTPERRLPGSLYNVSDYSIALMIALNYDKKQDKKTKVVLEL